MSIIVKRGASIEDCRRKILLVLYKIEPLYKKYNVDLVVTSGSEPYKHSALRSAHYRNDAVDIRSKSIPKEDRAKMLRKIKRKIGANYVVILESENKPNEHFHIHWSPVFGGEG